MLTSRFIQLLGTFAIGSLAAPTTTRFASIEGLEKRQNVTSLIDYLPSAEIHTSSWPQWAEETQRWSTYSAPTFDLIFIPKDEQEISAAVSLASYSCEMSLVLTCFHSLVFFRVMTFHISLKGEAMATHPLWLQSKMPS